MISHLRSGVLIFLLSAHLAAAQSVPDGMTMHRKSAGELDSSGWTNAASTEGRFSVRLPLKFNDFMMRMPKTEANLATMFGIGAKTTEGIKFLVQRFVYRGKDAASHFFLRVQAGTGFKTKPAAVNTHQYQGRPAVDMLLKDSRATGHLRYVLMDDSLIYLIVEVPEKSRSLVPKRMVRQFFDSLRVSPLESGKVGSSR